MGSSWIRLISLVLLLLQGAIALADDGYKTNIPPLPKLTDPPILTYSAVKEILKKNPNIRSVDDLLPLLPVEYRKHYTLMYQSRSLQKASAEKPRVILFGPDAKLMMTFSGDSNDPSFNTLELIEWNEKNPLSIFMRSFSRQRWPLLAISRYCMKMPQTAWLAIKTPGDLTGIPTIRGGGLTVVFRAIM